MKTRYAIMATNKFGDMINVFTDQRTYTNQAYAKRKLKIIAEAVIADDIQVVPIKTELFCPHCKCSLDLELEERTVG